MRRDNNHNLLIWLLALVVVFAPMQAAVSAIDMLDHNRGRIQHCQSGMADKMDHANMDHVGMDHGSCCQHEGACQGNCSACSPCVSVSAMLFGQTVTQNQPIKQFVLLKSSLATGIPGPSEYRPPRFFS